ncbi:MULTISPECIES: hypothetical protein [unclassified Sphingomonas]|uniref:hypothetical protein n=1 Tax=unclassified Sphingomonas TaxID=196159 RepID=UPI0006FBD457|nr:MULTISPECIES: hypothetical protein [unclassified Sphingomonas]KQM28358.1 hypothetical protein ASE58_00140 [Sphingomonas sp. Leaf9]KQM45064.1 hypothetical protein ASE57_00140 [Sphingomonas sp. Leaf11]KQM86557.1 hypothetical protein ASE67_12225 [Sphingomonas sp. Leaf23]
MALLVSALFAAGFVIAVATIFATVLPAKDRILRLLMRGPEWTIDPLPPVHLTSRRGVIRQRPITVVAQPLRAAA